MKQSLEILYEDNHLLCLNKRAGLLVQGDITGDVTLLELAKEYLKTRYKKPGKVFLGLVHRLDRPVSGLILFAKTSKAASRLSLAFMERRAEKTYLAVVEGVPGDLEGKLVSKVKRVGRRSQIVNSETRRSSQAVLHYEVLASTGKISLVELHPVTGRHHQLRVQMSHLGHRIVGDLKYGASRALEDRSIALHAWMLTMDHPVKKNTLSLRAEPPTGYPWSSFSDYLLIA